MDRDPKSRRTPPDWLIGLILAIVIFAAAAAVLRAAGAGDDPVVDAPDSGQGLELPAHG